MQHNQRPEPEDAQDALAFHAQLRSLIAANIPVCMDDRGGCASLASIESLQSHLQSHLDSNGDSNGTIDGYLSDDSLPLAYKIAMREWLYGAKQEALERLTTGSEGQRFYRNTVSFVFLQASLIVGAVLVGMVCICVWLVPKMEKIQSDSFTAPGSGMSALTALRLGLPYWGPVLLSISIIYVLFQRRILIWILTRWAPLHPESHALSEFQNLFSRPTRFQWLVSIVVVACGVCVLVQALSVLGVTIEILSQLVQS